MVTVYLILQNDEYGDGVYVEGAYATREEAQSHVDRYDRAVKRAVKDGAIGVCHVGDFYVTEIELGGDPLADLPKSLYLYDYLHGAKKC